MMAIGGKKADIIEQLARAMRQNFGERAGAIARDQASRSTDLGVKESWQAIADALERGIATKHER